MGEIHVVALSIGALSVVKNVEFSTAVEATGHCLCQVRLSSEEFQPIELLRQKWLLVLVLYLEDCFSRWDVQVHFLLIRGVGPNKQ